MSTVTTFLTDSINGTPVTFIEPATPPPANALNPSSLPNAQVRSSGVVRGDLRNDSGNEGNCLCTSASPLRNGCVTVWRFAGFQPAAQGTFSVAMSTEQHFGSSWGMRCISQRSMGNLCGRGMERSSWAKSYGADSTIDWYVELRENIVDVYPAVDGEYQGHAFHLDFSSRPELIAQLRPAVIFGGGCENLKVCLVEFEAVPIPTGDAPYRRRYTVPQTTPEGKWELVGASLPALELPEPVLLTVSPGDLSLKVCNSMRTAATFRSDGTAEVSGGVVMTRMMPPPQFQEAERVLADFLPTITQWKIEENLLILNNQYRFRAAVASGPVSTDIFL